MELKEFTFAKFCKLLVLNALYFPISCKRANSEVVLGLSAVPNLYAPVNH